MSVSSNISPEDNKINIVVNERFDFSLHQQFRDAYSQCTTKKLNYALDLSQIEYMDSSALGMILLLKDHVDMYEGTLVILNPSDTVNKILTIAQFHRLMTIER
ncbi:MAG: STAS domain-containing protein [Colwellia sp.]|nr:STAS domain-containing protein [Colwellia sp.]